MTRKKSAVILLSGGLDSAFHLAWAYEDDYHVWPLVVDYGQKAKEAEIRAAHQLSAFYHFNRPHEVDLSWLGLLSSSALTSFTENIPVQNLMNETSARDVWVPNRNGVFLHVASAFAEAHGIGTVFFGANREEAETFPDNSHDFIERTNEGLKYSTRNQVQIEAWTRELTKAEMVERIKSFHHSFPYHLIWSCYQNGKELCRRCESCRRFFQALKEGGVSLDELGSAFQDSLDGR